MQKTTFFRTLTKAASFILLAGTTVFFTSCEKGEDIFDDFLGKDKDKDMAEMRIFASTNTGGNFTIFDVSDLHDIDITVASTGSMDADGIFYSQDKDIVYQLSRTESMVNGYTDIMDLMGKKDVRPAFSSTSDFTNGREITVEGDMLVVAEDVDDMNQLVVYKVYEGALRLDKTYRVHINLWGIQLVNGTLYAVEDGTNNLAVYNDFGSQPDDQNLGADMKVAIEGLVRTHGLNYDAMHDVMVLTDIADATVDSDGGFHVIENFSTKLMDAGDEGMIMMDDQIRVAGDMTYLGNPVDVALSVEAKKIYVAERANGGGRLLIFDYPMESGNMKPIANVNYEGASAVYLDEEMQ
ncbi:MAG: hypothetical protein RIG62_14880 [Cyclobacteriaceae bacterium]